MLIKSQVKYIQSLSQKKLRDEEKAFVAEGPKIINELLQSAVVAPKQLFALKEWLSHNEELLANLRGVDITEVSLSEMTRISSLNTPNQVLGIFTKPDWASKSSSPESISLMLDTIQDPGNLGTIIRTADWFGVRNIICSLDTADVYSPKVVQSTMGSITRVQLQYTGLINYLEANTEVPVYAATLDGTPLDSVGKISKGILLIGNESKGISAELLQKSTHHITIPRIGEAESLNAAVAAGIILSRVTG